METFPIVAIGSSAGGLEALRAFLGGMRADSGAAFVIVSHLDPTHVSYLPELLQKCTEMPVHQITENVRLAPDRVYVIAPDQDLTIEGGVLQPDEPSSPRGHRHPVDSFFRSLAEDQGERAIAVVLSGTGSNGSLGLRFVKAEGGIVLVQDPETAGFNGMPRNAIDTGLADFVLSPEKMGETLIGIFEHSYTGAPVTDDAPQRQEEDLHDLLSLVRARSGKDFRSYRKKTLLRRIRRRMGLHRIERIEAYTEYLGTHEHEMKALIGDLTINVTGFFRDADAWRELREKVVVPLVRDRRPDMPIRVWVPGCSTGEESYSIAILIMEEAERQGKQIALNVFATDVADGVLPAARAGAYPSSIEQVVSRDRLKRFFDFEEDTYTVKKFIRETITFAPQNLVQDPPFSRIDIVACRNLLIYLEPQTQKRVLNLFHFSLRQDGHLFLGTAETASAREELFETVSKKWRIYRRIGPTRHDVVDFPLLEDRRWSRSDGATSYTLPAPQNPRGGEMADRAILDRFAPASVLIDERFRIFHFRGPTGDYLQPPNGEPNNNLISMAREGLAIPLRGLVRKAIESRREAAADARVWRNGRHELVHIVASLLPAGDSERRLLVSFVDRQARTATSNHGSDTGGEDASDLLQGELDGVREELRLTVHQMEISNDELKASNEEIRSINEELQASNEELETSKEELQSLNEELNTVNNQLEAKLTELEERTADLNNLLNSTDIATLFLDRSLCIRWFTPGMKELLTLRSTDVGRPASHFAQRFTDGDMLEEASQVLDTLRPAEGEVLSDAGRWFMRRILPYRTRNDHIEGVVLTFIDITERKQSEAALRASENRYRYLFNAIDQGFCIIELIYDAEGRASDYTFLEVNAAFEGQTGLKNAQGQSMRALAPDHEDHWFERFAEIVATGASQNFEAEASALGHFYEVFAFKVGAPEEPRVGVLFKDIMERKRADQERELLTHELSHRVKNTLAVVQSIALQTDSDNPSVDPYREKFLGRLRSLGRVHGLLLQSHWRGTELRKLAGQELAPFDTDSGVRIALDGASLDLSVRQALGLSMVLHELATNATKYGALSTPEGRVHLSWRIEERDTPTVHLKWHETGGPPVQSPRHQGFGSQLVERALEYEIGAEAKLDYAPDGVICEIAFPMEV